MAGIIRWIQKYLIHDSVWPISNVIRPAFWALVATALFLIDGRHLTFFKSSMIFLLFFPYFVLTSLFSYSKSADKIVENGFSKGASRRESAKAILLIEGIAVIYFPLFVIMYVLLSPVQPTVANVYSNVLPICGLALVMSPIFFLVDPFFDRMEKRKHRKRRRK